MAGVFGSFVSKVRSLRLKATDEVEYSDLKPTDVELTDFSASESEVEPSPKANEKFSLQADTSCGLILACARFLDADSVMARGKATSIAYLGVAAFLHGMAMFLFVFLPLLLYVFPIEQAQDVFENGSFQQHIEILKAHLSQKPPKPLDSKDPLEADVLKICSSDHTVQYAQSILIILWLFRLTPGIVQAMWLVYASHKVPVAKAGESLIDEKGDKINIVRSPLGLKRVTVYLITGPRLLALLGVAYVGSKFLFFASNLTDLILRVPPLFFLAQLDNVIFTALASTKFQNNVASSALHYHSERMPEYWGLWGATLAKTSVVFALAIYYARVRHARLQEWRELCLAYESVFVPACPQCGLHLFGYTIYH